MKTHETVIFQVTMTTIDAEKFQQKTNADLCEALVAAFHHENVTVQTAVGETLTDGQMSLSIEVINRHQAIDTDDEAN